MGGFKKNAIGSGMFQANWEFFWGVANLNVDV
jgi:hypothetical protein